MPGPSSIRRRNVVISCENIQKTYLLGTEGVPALRGVSCDVYEGEFCVIYGTSGGGKTTLLNILGTIDQPTKGNLAIMGQRLTARTEDTVYADLRLNRLGFVFQTFNLLATMTALENVMVPMVLAGKLSAAERKARAVALLESVGMGERCDHYPSMLSGGEQQRVTIARAMANKPTILLLDEPTGDLDTKNTKIVIDLLMKLNKEQGVTLVMVTHDPEMKWYANRAVYVRDGKIGNVEEIPEAENDKALAELRESLESGGMQPGGLDSALAHADGVGDSTCANGNGDFGGMPSKTATRDPSDYTTYHPDATTMASDSRGASLFASLFNKPEHSGISIEMHSLSRAGSSLNEPLAT